MAGLCCLCRRRAASVLLCERDYLPGGQLVKQTHKFLVPKNNMPENAASTSKPADEKAKHHPNIEILTEATVLGIYEDGIVTVFITENTQKIRHQNHSRHRRAEKFLEFPAMIFPVSTVPVPCSDPRRCRRRQTG